MQDPHPCQTAALAIITHEALSNLKAMRTCSRPNSVSLYTIAWNPLPRNAPMAVTSEDDHNYARTCDG